MTRAEVLARFPRPWRAKENEIVDATGHHITWVCPSGVLRIGSTEALAALIVEAVNGAKE